MPHGYSTPGRRLGTFLLAAGAAALLTSPVAGEPVQHTYTGTVDFVTDGSAGTVDLTGTFSSGQAVTLIYTTERTTAGFPSKTGEIVYFGAVTALSLAIGTYTGGLGPASFSSIIVGNDINLVARERPSSPMVDFYFFTVSSPTGASVGQAVPTALELDLWDDEATQFADASLPRVMPDLAAFETSTWVLTFFDSNVTMIGLVSGSLGSVSTPASASTWGRVKAQYRN